MSNSKPSGALHFHWSALLVACATAAALSAYWIFPGDWCDSLSVRTAFGLLMGITAMLYIWFVDDERRPLAGTAHRVLVGGLTGVVLAAIAGGPGMLYALLAVLGAMLGYVGFRWLKHLPI
jgi:hypothetical protein